MKKSDRDQFSKSNRDSNTKSDQKFHVVAPFEPMGDQPRAIDDLASGIENGQEAQVLLGATGTGKTFTIAKVVERVQKPTLVIAHNKTLAAQLASEFKSFFPNNYVGYFVSYYDYYQPEAYLPATDTYIAKDAAINDEIDQMRHSATCSLFERKDVLIVASVSCIYGLGSPENYSKLVVSLHEGDQISREKILEKLVSIRYERNDLSFERGRFRVRGDRLEIFPAGYQNRAIRVEMFDDSIEKISEFDPTTGKVIGTRKHAMIFPASHHVTLETAEARKKILAELDSQVKKFQHEGKLIEAQRIEERTRTDLEMIEEMGYCSGIENYSRHFDRRKAGDPPFTLLDYFPRDFLLVVDESHATLPQIRAMYNGDHARKSVLVDNGFRLPSAFDNRPLTFEEFYSRINQAIYVSATPAQFELDQAQQITEQIIRPTGLLDPIVEVRPLEGQIDDLISEIRLRTKKSERVLITTLTKKFAEHLTEYLEEEDIRVRYMHSDIATLDRAEIIRALRAGEFDVLVGINLLREGLDLPEVSLIAILDADKEGFLRSETSLIQIIGRAARNQNGMVILYADRVTDSMKRAMNETRRRRKIQEKYNLEHGIIPKTIEKPIRPLLESTLKLVDSKQKISKKDRQKLLDDLMREMKTAASEMNFERAAQLRDAIFDLDPTFKPSKPSKPSNQIKPR